MKFYIIYWLLLMLIYIILPFLEFLTKVEFADKYSVFGFDIDKNKLWMQETSIAILGSLQPADFSRI